MRMYVRFIALTIIVTGLVADAPTRVSLRPAFFDRSDVMVQAACNRPRRSEGINISVEQKEEKTIIHCYGHGGSGFTTLFGSIQEALDLFLAQNPDLDTPIRIIGSGCMGLTMAVELHQKGFTHISLSTKERYNLPSWRAGGFFDPGTGSEQTPKALHQLQLGLKTYSVLRTIEHGEHPYLPSSLVKQLPVYWPVTMESDVEVLEKLKLMPASELVTLDFGSGVVHEGYKRQLTYFIDVSHLMKTLWQMIKTLNIPVVDEEITSFAQCQEPIIFNCTGVGSRTLNNDTAVYPGRGHFFMLQAQTDGQSFDYMLYTQVEQNGKKGMIYFFPKPRYVDEAEERVSAGILGGTLINCTDMTPQELQVLDEHEFMKLAERAHAFFHGS